MKKTCKKCMSRYEGEVCPLCSQNNTEARSRPAQTEQEKKNQKRMLIFLCILGVAFVIFIFYRNGVFGGRVYEEQVTAYFNAICNKDFDSYISVMTDEVAKELVAEKDELGLEKEEYMATLFADYFEEFGDDMTVSIAFGKSDGVGSEYIDMFADDYFEEYGVYPQADAFKQLEAAVTFTGSNDVDVIMVRCYLMRDDIRWYMVGCDYLDEIRQIEGEDA